MNPEQQWGNSPKGIDRKRTQKKSQNDFSDYDKECESDNFDDNELFATSESVSEQSPIIISDSKCEISETPVVPEPAPQNTDEQITTNEEKNNNETLHARDWCSSFLICSKTLKKFIFENYLQTQLIQIALKTENHKNDINTDITYIFISIFNDFHS